MFMKYIYIYYTPLGTGVADLNLNPFLAPLSHVIRKHAVIGILGTFKEKPTCTTTRCYNTCALIDRKGNSIGFHR